MPPPSGQSPAPTSSTESPDEAELPTVAAISRRTATQSRRSRSSSLSSTDSEPEEYFIEWLVYMGKLLLHSDVVSPAKWDLADHWRGQKQRVKQTLENRGKGEKLAHRIAGIPVAINAKGMKVLQLSAHEVSIDGWWNKIDD